MWDVPNPPNPTVVQWIQQIEATIPPADAAVIRRIEFSPGSRKDPQVGGNGGTAFPWEEEGLIVINHTNAQDLQVFRGTVAHEVGHYIDWRDTGWLWHIWPGDLLWPNDAQLDAVAHTIMEQAAEFFASGYAVQYGFMDRDMHELQYIRQLAQDVRALLQSGQRERRGTPRSGRQAVAGACGTVQLLRAAQVGPRGRRERRVR